jgi:hypothetical protein
MTMFATPLAPLDCCSEDIRVLAIIVAKLELGNIERKILFADLVESADTASLNQRPEALDCVGVDRAHNIIALGVIDNGVRMFLSEMLVADPLVGAKQADLVRDRLMYRRTLG